MGIQRGISSPADTPHGQRAMALHSDNADRYNYEIITPLDVKSREIAPWFGKEGEELNLLNTIQIVNPTL